MVATKVRKTTSVDITGIVERADVLERAPFAPMFYRGGENSEVVLDVCVRVPDGSAVYFKTVPVEKHVASCSAAAVVIYTLKPEADRVSAKGNKYRVLNWVRRVAE